MAGAAVALLAVLPGCSSETIDVPPPTITPGSAAVSPPTAAAAAGRIVELGAPVSAAGFDAGTDTLVVLLPGPDPGASARLARLSGVSGAAQAELLELPGPAGALVTDGAGTAYLATRGGYFTVDLRAWAAARVGIADQDQTDFTAITRRADGRLVLGTADGAVCILNDDGAAVEHRVKIFARVDSLAAQGNTTLVLDRGQTSVTTLGTDGATLQALRAGDGATTLVVDPAGRALVADPRTGQLLVFGVDPLMLRQRYPVGDAPYGLAGSDRLTWVSKTATNEVVGYHLATGIPTEEVRYPTVRQPDVLAYDDATDTLYVASGDGAGIQVIERASEGR